MEVESTERVEDQNMTSTKHAPDLLEGPNLKEESMYSSFTKIILCILFFCPVPDVSLGGVDDSPYFLKPLLSALGVSRKKPSPQKYQFATDDTMGESLFRQDQDDPLKGEEEAPVTAEGGGVVDHDTPPPDCCKISSLCDEVMSQVQRLRTVEERVCALWRLTTGVQVLVARHVALMLVAHMSVQTSRTAVATLRNLELLDVQSLVRLLRLVGAGRVSNTPGGSFAVTLPSSLHPLRALQCLSNAISSVVTDEVPASQSILAGLERLAGDDQLLHIRGAFVDAKRADLAIERFGDAAVPHAFAAEKLNCAVDHLLCAFGGKELGHCGFAADPWLAAVFGPCRAVDQKRSGVDIKRHLRDMRLHHLQIRQRAALDFAAVSRGQGTSRRPCRHRCTW